MGFFNDDICWCGNSNPKETDYCDKTFCFRHMANRKSQEAPDIFTMGMLKNTEVCPYYKEVNHV